MSKKKSSPHLDYVDKETGEVIEPKTNVKPHTKTIRTQLRQMEVPFSEKNDERESNHKPSNTTPGLSMTILEMVKRHQKGLPIDQSKGPIYQEGDEPLPDISQMDLVDRQAYMDSVADALVEVKQRIAASAKTEEEQKFLAAVDVEVRKKMAEIVIPDASK